MRGPIQHALCEYVHESLDIMRVPAEPHERSLSSFPPTMSSSHRLHAESPSPRNSFKARLTIQGPVMSGTQLTVVIRSTEGESVDKSVESIQAAAARDELPEILVVSRGVPTMSDENQALVHLLISGARRIEAKAIGVRGASSDRILFLDSDQYVSPSLLGELRHKSEDMVLIPERSVGASFMGSILDSRRVYIESKMRATPSPRIPVIPRFFRKAVVQRALDSMPPEVIKEVTETEDSLIFYECLKLSSSLGWCECPIFNDDPGVLAFTRKSYSYGYRNENAIAAGRLPPDYVRLIRDIQRGNIVNSGLPSVGAFTGNLIRGVPYLAGTLVRRLGF